MSSELKMFSSNKFIVLFIRGESVIKFKQQQVKEMNGQRNKKLDKSWNLSYVA